MGGTPTLPEIDAKGASDVSIARPTFGSGGPTVKDILSQSGIQSMATGVTVPYATTGTATAPEQIHLHAPNQKQMIPEGIAPHANTRYAERLAVRHNNFAQVTNALNQYANKKAQDKFEDNKAEIATVMKAQQQIDNANQVLANDPNNALAKQVIEQNKKVIEGKFADPKTGKLLQKAFDVSFTDPEKNDTPEVKAMQAATKDVKAATAADVDHNTMGEKEVGDLAEGKNLNTTQKAAAALPPPPPKPSDVATGQRSGTPYADQFLKQSTATINPNPMYQEQLKQQYALEQRIQQYVIPKLIDAQVKQNNMEMAQSGANARAQLKYTTEYSKAIMDSATKLKVSDERNKAYIKGIAMKDATSVANTEKRVNAAIQIAGTKGIKGTDRAKQLLDNEAKQTNAEINTAVKTLTELKNQQAMNTDKSTGKIIDQNQADFLAFQIGSTQARVTALSAIMNDKLAPQLPGQGLPDFSNPMGNNQVWSMANGLIGDTTATTPEFSTTGPADDSDEANENAIINSVLQD